MSTITDTYRVILSHSAEIEARINLYEEKIEKYSSHKKADHIRETYNVKIERLRNLEIPTVITKALLIHCNNFASCYYHSTELNKIGLIEEVLIAAEKPVSRYNDAV